MYTFDDQLTTDQKLAHLADWIVAEERAIAAARPDGSDPNPERRATHEERLRLLSSWLRLIQVEEELAASKPDSLDPDPLGDEMQEDWCRVARLELRIAGLRQRLAVIQRSSLPWFYRPRRVEEKIARLTGRLRSARRALRRSAEMMTHQDYSAIPCLEKNEQGAPCRPEAPCLACRENGAASR